MLTGSLGSADVEEFAGRSSPACNPERTWADGPFFCAPSCRTISFARRLTVLPRPRTSRCLPMSHWPYRPHRSDACNEVDKAHVCAQNVHSRALIVRSGARTEFPELLYAAIRFLATSQPVATRNSNASQRKIHSEIMQRFIHTLDVYTPCSSRSRHIKIPLNHHRDTVNALCRSATASRLPQTLCS